jgi:hypothetical protein
MQGEGAVRSISPLLVRVLQPLLCSSYDLGASHWIPSRIASKPHDKRSSERESAEKGEV